MPAMDYVVYERGVTVSAECGSDILAYIVNPYFNRTYEHFCSHRQTPPGSITCEPAIVKTENTVYISSPLFKDYALNGCKIYKDIIKDCIDRLINKPLIDCKLPSTAELQLRKQKDAYVLHILSYIIQKKCKNLDTIEEKFTLYDQEISMRMNEEPQRLYLAPQMDELPFDFDYGYVRFIIPIIDGHQMIVIEQETL